MGHRELQFTRTWLVSCDAQEGRIYSYVTKNHPWKLVAEVVSPPDGGITACAEQLVARLEHGRTHATFDRVVLVAHPIILGALRRAMSPALDKLVTLTIAKDYVHATVDELHDAILDQLPLD